MRICSVINCGNSTYTIERWRQETCRLHVNTRHETGNCDCPRPFKLFPFPSQKTDPEARKRWIKVINRKDTKTNKNWNPVGDSRVCSKHFINGCPTVENPDPTLELGYEMYQNTSKRKLPTERLPPPKKQKQCFQVDVDKEVVFHDHNYIYECACTNNCACSGCTIKQKDINVLKEENQLLKQLLANKEHKTKSSLTKVFLKSSKSVKAFTNLPNRKAFWDLLGHLLPTANKMTYWKGSKRVLFSKVRKFSKGSPAKQGPSRKLLPKDELLLVLMKLRLGLTNLLLASIFCVSQTIVSQVFNTWIKLMSVELKPLVFWPNKETIISQLPSVLKKKFPQLRCTLDCTEIFIDRPRHLELQAQTWSDYKKHNTAKLLVAIAPNGTITFLSKVWGGRTSDRHITKESGFLDLIDPYDTVLADRGFTIQEDLMLRHATLYIPPPSSGLEQQSRQDVLKTKTIANARIHVERAIGRLKCFHLLKTTLPITLIPLLDEIVLVCAALCNLMPPLVQ